VEAVEAVKAMETAVEAIETAAEAAVEVVVGPTSSLSAYISSKHR